MDLSVQLLSRLETDRGGANTVDVRSVQRTGIIATVAYYVICKKRNVRSFYLISDCPKH